MAGFEVATYGRFSGGHRGLGITISNLANDSRWRTGLGLIVALYISLYMLVRIYQIQSAVDAYVTPRSVTQEQADVLVQYLSDFSPFSVTVKVNPIDGEALQYWGQIGQALQRTKWTVNMSTDTNEEPNLLNDGVCLNELGAGRRPHFDPHNDPRMLLQEAFAEADMPLTCAGNSEAGEYRLFILVGHRPFNIPDPRITKLREWLVRTMKRIIWWGY